MISKVLKNLKISNLYYLIQGYYKEFIKTQYNKYFDEDGIDDLMYKAAKCPQCYLAGECIGNYKGDPKACHCAFTELANSDKKCPHGRF